MSETLGSGENRIAVDWDGTLVESKWPEMGDWLPGAKEELRRFLDAGFEVVIFSTRLAGCEVDEATPRPEEMSREILRVREMLDAAGLQEVGIWAKPWKIGARYYIDDKAIEFTGNWLDVRERIANDLEGLQVDVACNAFPDSGNYVTFGPPAKGTLEERVRQFGSGATRNTDTNKPDYEGFLSPLVLREFGRYMHEHRHQADGSVRASDNWKKGIPLDAYAKSLLRHVMDVWSLHRGEPAVDYDSGAAIGMKDALTGVMFNAMGYLHETLKAELAEKDAA